MLTTQAIIKEELKITGVGLDAIIDRAIDAASTWIAGEINRFDAVNGVSLIERQVGRVEFPTPEPFGEQIVLGAYPIESVAEIKQAYDRDFNSATALVDGTDFMIDPSSGGDAIVHLRSGFFHNSGPAGIGIIRVTYTGGYWVDLVNPPPAGAVLVPSALTQAATRLAVHLVKNRDKFGERSFSAGDMQVSGVKDEMFKMIREMIQPFRNLR